MLVENTRCSSFGSERKREVTLRLIEIRESKRKKKEGVERKERKQREEKRRRGKKRKKGR